MPSHMKCCFNRCSNTSRSAPNLSFHKFPTNQSLCKKWVDVCSNEKISQLFNLHGSSLLCKSFRVCSEHFTQKDYLCRTYKKKMLIKGSVPTEQTMVPKTAAGTNTIERWRGAVTKENKADEHANHNAPYCFPSTDTTNRTVTLPNFSTLTADIYSVADLVALDYRVLNCEMNPITP